MRLFVGHSKSSEENCRQAYISKSAQESDNVGLKIRVKQAKLCIDTSKRWVLQSELKNSVKKCLVTKIVDPSMIES